MSMNSAPAKHAFVLGLLTLALSCSETQSKRCKDVCQKESECAERQGTAADPVPYDVEECISACVVLERDQNSQSIVDTHIECAKASWDNCEKLLSCR